MHSNIFIIHLHTVRFSLLNENAGETNLKAIFIRNNKQNSDIATANTLQKSKEKIESLHIGQWARMFTLAQNDTPGLPIAHLGGGNPPNRCPGKKLLIAHCLCMQPLGSGR